MSLGEHVFAALLRAYPREFRERYGTDLRAFFREERRHPRYGTGVMRPLRFWVATLGDLTRAAATERVPLLQHRSRSTKEGVRMPPWSALRFDVRNAVRSLTGTPAVTLTAVAVLTLGIGASTAIFSLVDGVVLRALPFPGAEQLLAVNETDLASGRPLPAAWQEYADWAQQQDVFTGLAASATAPFWTTRDHERPEQLRPYRVTANLFEVLGVPPAIGQGFTERGVAGNAKVAMLSDALWRRRFGADPQIIGRTIAFDTGVYEVVGVMPRGFVYPVGSAIVSAIDLWVPFVPSPRETVRGNSKNFQLRVVGRLKPGVTLAQAAGRMKALNDRLAAASPSWFAGRGVLVRPLKESIVPPTVRSWMLMLLAAVAGVLLVACANIANLLLARVGGRGREIGVRAAMGATRWQLVRGMIVESLVLSLTGAAGGLLFAYRGLDILKASLPSALPRVGAIAVDLRVIAAASAAAIVTGFLCGLLPALQLSRVDVSTALRGMRAASTRQRARTVFLVLEVAITAVLLVGAGIFTTSFLRVVRTDLGFDARGALSVQVNAKLPNDSSDRQAFRQAVDRANAALPLIVERLRAMPGVTGASIIAGGAPLSGSWASKAVTTADRDADEEVIVKEASDGYLEAVGATVLRGRTIQPGDTNGAPAVAVISDIMATQYFGARDPIGQTLTIEQDVPRRIVGVVRAMRLLGPEAALRPEIYVPYAQQASHSVSGSLVIRTVDRPSASIPAIKNAIWAILPDASIPEPQTFEQMYAGLIAQRKLNMLLLALFGALALLIASIGIYGVFAYVVQQRTREIGVRMALGAVPRRITRMVLGRATAAIGCGLALGFVAARWLEHGIMSFVFAGRPHDPVVYGAAATLVLALGCLAAYVPARRAAHVDPLIAIRAE